MRADARRNYERLLAVADELFRRDGTDASLEEVARRAEVGIGTLYRHFPTRDALLEALLREQFAELRAAAERLARVPPRQALDEFLLLFTARISLYRGLPAALVAMLRAPDTALHEACHAMNQAGERLVEQLQRAGVVREDVPAKDVLALTASVAWLGEQTGDEQQRERLLRVVTDGFNARNS
ncbi:MULTISPECIES: TetR/AcrR family transcriptional regulator [unclassified Crossiella]|uniref:TetR/AcrR family transcriptional regulator n=1 Tax=unclassified Crossiella TaxID=2620835 RepID=UPI001FFF2232|nr:MULTISPECIES: TetR/AcrR family transcriptional regulator [unclassified Crossiella]MCK2240749.1 TetR/AcrR family transcriptional regulator [Crossiella sp. S99.2]MCK2254107.1 TetR/AcrR family transcriptional regulator [Crossiella sp. S99.1]